MERALSYFKRSADSGDVTGAYEFAIETLDTNDCLALTYFRKAVKGGHPGAVFWIGVFHDHTRTYFNRDYGRAVECYTRAFDGGEFRTALNLDILY
jgi:TPR repeat protein